MKKILYPLSSISSHSRFSQQNGLYPRQTGQVMVESMVAISMTIVGLLGVVSLLTYALNQNRQISKKFIASYLAVEGIEIVKSIIDRNHTDGDASTVFNSGITNGKEYEAVFDNLSLIEITGAPRYLNLDGGTGIYTYASGAATPFTRVMKIEEIVRSTPGTDEIKIISTVRWSRDAKDMIEIEDHFFDWRL